MACKRSRLGQRQAATWAPGSGRSPSPRPGRPVVTLSIPEVLQAACCMGRTSVLPGSRRSTCSHG
jgi:hypothetical protein